MDFLVDDVMVQFCFVPVSSVTKTTSFREGVEEKWLPVSVKEVRVMRERVGSPYKRGFTTDTVVAGDATPPLIVTTATNAPASTFSLSTVHVIDVVVIDWMLHVPELSVTTSGKEVLKLAPLMTRESTTVAVVVDSVMEGTGSAIATVVLAVKLDTPSKTSFVV